MNRAVLIHEHGDASVLRLGPHELPAPGAGEVLVSQQAIGVNFVDTMVRSGQFCQPLPTVLGFEAAGVVAAVGDGPQPFAVGDRVGYFFAPGAYADLNVVDASRLVALPGDASFVQAAAFLAKGLTAWMGLRALHPLKAGDAVLVQGASGSVGSILSRWALHLGATVIGVASSSRKLETVARGATLALAADDPYFLDKVRALVPQGVDAVYDFVGDASYRSSLAAVRDGGKVLAIGAASGQPRIDPAELARRNVQVLRGSTPQFVNPTNQADATAQLFQALQAGIFDDLPISRRSLAEAPLVHQQIAARRSPGLTVLLP